MILKKFLCTCLIVSVLTLVQIEVTVLLESEESDDKMEDDGFSYPENIDDDLSASQDPTFGQLTGDVQNWGAIIQNYILQVFRTIKFISTYEEDF